MMRWRTVLECAVILSAASIAAADQASDTVDLARDLVCQSAAAVYSLDSRPWAPTYQMWRDSGLKCQRRAEFDLGIALDWLEVARVAAARIPVLLDPARIAAAEEEYQQAIQQAIMWARSAISDANAAMTCADNARAVLR